MIIAVAFFFLQPIAKGNCDLCIVFSGLPHGPYWILPSLGCNQYMYVHFNHGHLVMEKSIVIDTSAKYALMGNLNQTHYLEEAEMVDLEQIAEYKCMTVLKIPQNDPQAQYILGDSGTFLDFKVSRRYCEGCSF